MIENLIESRYMPAALEALSEFPVQVKDIKLVFHSENITFRITPESGKPDYSLRLHRPGYNSLAELESERSWARALGESGIMVPEPLKTRSGEEYHLLEIPAVGESRYAGMTAWIKGAPLSEFLPGCTRLEEKQDIFRQLGKMVARLHEQSSSWALPPGFQRRKLDRDGLLGENPSWGRFWEHKILSPSQQKLLEATRLRIGDVLEKFSLGSNGFGLIHADMTLDNMIYDGNRLAIIDFDDTAFGWYMYDIAVALFEERKAADFPKLLEAFLDGYRELRRLDEREVDSLPLFMLIRGLALIGWFQQRPELGDTPYLLELKDQICEECERLDPMAMSAIGTGG